MPNVAATARTQKTDPMQGSGGASLWTLGREITVKSDGMRDDGTFTEDVDIPWAPDRHVNGRSTGADFSAKTRNNSIEGHVDPNGTVSGKVEVWDEKYRLLHGSVRGTSNENEMHLEVVDMFWTPNRKLDITKDGNGGWTARTDFGLGGPELHGTGPVSVAQAASMLLGLGFGTS